MYRFFSVLTMCTAILIGGGFGIGLTHAQAAEAKADPEGIFRGFISALNNGDKAAAAALLDDNVTFFEPNGDGSFGIVGKKAFVGSALPDIATSSFHATVRHAEVHGDKVSGTLATSDDTTKAAGVSRYFETFTVRIVDGKIVSIDLLYDTSDSATNTYIEYSRSQSNNDGPLPDTIEVTLGSGAEGSQPGTAFLAAADWAGEGVSLVGVQVQPGAAGVLQSANLVSGSCAAPGKTVYPLAAVVDGGSFTVISASVDEILAKGLSVQVHQAGQTDRVNACGAVLAAAVAPAPPAPAPPTLTIKPPATGTGPAPGGGLPSLLLTALVAAGAFAVMAGAGIRRNQPR